MTMEALPANPRALLNANTVFVALHELELSAVRIPACTGIIDGDVVMPARS